MFVSIIHRISDPDAFWAAAASATPKLPADVKVHQTAAGKDRTTAICLWEAPSVERIRDLIEPLLGNISKNEYVVLDPASSMGLPTGVTATA